MSEDRSDPDPSGAEAAAASAHVRERLRGRFLAEGLTVEETHISLVLIGDAEVWKIKKPVALGFLDFSTLDKRRRACRAEVELNRRLAPYVYMGVVPVSLDGRGVPALNGEGPPVEWAVHMLRLPLERRADRLLANGALEGADLERLARRLARFHGSARCDGETSRFGSVTTVRGNVQENFEQTRPFLDEYLRREHAGEIEAWQLDFLARRGDLFEQRLESGRVRDGHGDLRLEHVYLAAPNDAGPPFDDDGLAVIDCIEFNDRFRYADVCADVAFLAMDLAWHQRVDLAERFLAAYAEAADDWDLYAVADFYESYRAFVRGKIAGITAAQPSVEHTVAERARAEARRYFRLAQASERRPLLGPRLFAVGGLLAAGKSTLARQMATRLSAPVLSADPTRKHLLGIEPETPVHDAPFAGAYAPETTERVYRELERRARLVLESGRPVVVDASFRSAPHRLRFRDLAGDVGASFRFVECRAPREVLEERLVLRSRGRSVSDGRLEILDEFIANYEPVAELAGTEMVTVDTSAPLERCLDQALAGIPAWPPGPQP